MNSLPNEAVDARGRDTVHIEDDDEDNEIILDSEMLNLEIGKKKLDNKLTFKFDYNRIRAVDIMMICISFAPPGSYVKCVRVYSTDDVGFKHFAVVTCDDEAGERIYEELSAPKYRIILNELIRRDPLNYINFDYGNSIEICKKLSDKNQVLYTFNSSSLAHALSKLPSDDHVESSRVMTNESDSGETAAEFAKKRRKRRSMKRKIRRDRVEVMNQPEICNFQTLELLKTPETACPKTPSTNNTSKSESPNESSYISPNVPPIISPIVSPEVHRQGKRKTIFESIQPIKSRAIKTTAEEADHLPGD